MKVKQAKTAGFCMGVRRALERVLGETYKDAGPIFTYGPLIHNEQVKNLHESEGVQVARNISTLKHGTIIIRAHGIPPQERKLLKASGLIIIDATFPMVKSIHKIAQRMEQEGYTIIIIGDKNHSEVHGIIGQLTKRPIVIERLHDIPVRTLKKVHKAAVVVQSTQNAETVFKIIDEIKSYIPDLQFFNTICRPTRMRQAERRTMPLKNDVMVIIGSRTSANTQRLCQISHALNEKTYCVQSKDELQPEWFRGARSVGVASGASTPDKTIQEAIDYLRSISRLLKK